MEPTRLDQAQAMVSGSVQELERAALVCKGRKTLVRTVQHRGLGDDVVGALGADIRCNPCVEKCHAFGVSGKHNRETRCNP